MTFESNAAIEDGQDATTGEQSLRDIAREALEGADWNAHKAAGAVAARVRGSDALLHELVLAYLGTMNREVRTAERGAIRLELASPAPRGTHDPDQRGHRVSALARGNAAMLLEWRLPDGFTRMRDALRPQLRKCAEMQYRQGNTMVIDARWYALVAAKLPDDSTKVSKVLDEQALRKLKEKSTHART